MFGVFLTATQRLDNWCGIVRSTWYSNLHSSYLFSQETLLPGCCPKYADLDPQQGLSNLALGVEVAASQLVSIFTLYYK